MAGYFIDSSALGKFYHDEIGTVQVERLFLQPDRRIFISRLTVVELQSVFAGKLRAGMITDAEISLLRRRLSSDIVRRNLNVVRIVARHYHGAERLIREHGSVCRLRTLDALQLSVALDLRSLGLLGHFVASDKVLCQVAIREGLIVINPEETA